MMTRSHTQWIVFLAVGIVCIVGSVLLGMRIEKQRNDEKFIFRRALNMQHDLQDAERVLSIFTDMREELAQYPVDPAKLKKFDAEIADRKKAYGINLHDHLYDVKHREYDKKVPDGYDPLLVEKHFKRFD